MMSDAEVAAIDDWSFQHRVRTRADAVRRLCQIGLAAEAAAGQIHDTLYQLENTLAVGWERIGDIRTRSDDPAVHELATTISKIADLVYDASYQSGILWAARNDLRSEDSGIAAGVDHLSTIDREFRFIANLLAIHASQIDPTLEEAEMLGKAGFARSKRLSGIALESHNPFPLEDPRHARFVEGWQTAEKADGDQ